MAKKKNKKLKKILRAQAFQGAESIESRVESGPSNKDRVVTDKAEPVISKKEAQAIQISEDKKDVRHEVKKILITIAILVLIIIAVDLINNRTDIILKIGQFFADKLNLNL